MDNTPTFTLTDNQGTVLAEGTISKFTGRVTEDLIPDMTEFKEDEDIHELYPNLFISNRITAQNFRLLQNYKIKAIISINNFFKNENVLKGYAKMGIDHYHYNLYDHPDSNIKRIADITNKIIDHYLSIGERVLVHCEMGISRSASIVISYIMWKENKPYFEVLPDVRKIRNIIRPNKGFETQLKSF